MFFYCLYSEFSLIRTTRGLKIMVRINLSILSNKPDFIITKKSELQNNIYLIQKKIEIFNKIIFKSLELIFDYFLYICLKLFDYSFDILNYSN